MEEYKKDAIEASHDDKVIGLYDKELEEKYLKEAIYDEGIETGRKECSKEKTISIARSMLNDKLDIDTICKYTGLSKEKVKLLQ